MEFKNCSLSTETLTFIINNIKSVKTLELQSVSVTGNYSRESERNNSVNELHMKNLTITVDTMHDLLFRMSNVHTLLFQDSTITGSTLANVMIPNLFRLTLENTKLHKIILARFLRSNSTIKELTFKNVEILQVIPQESQDRRHITLEELDLSFSKTKAKAKENTLRFLSAVTAINKLIVRVRENETMLCELVTCVPAIQNLEIYNGCSFVICNTTCCQKKCDNRYPGILYNEHSKHLKLKELHECYANKRTIPIKLLLRAHSSLKTLTLYNVGITAEFCGTATSISKSSSLRIFEMRFSILAETPIDLTFLSEMPHLECLKIKNVKILESQETKRQGFANTLKKFYLSYSEVNEEKNEITENVFKSMPSVEMIELVDVCIKENFKLSFLNSSVIFIVEYSNDDNPFYTEYLKKAKPFPRSAYSIMPKVDKLSLKGIITRDITKLPLVTCKKLKQFAIRSPIKSRITEQELKWFVDCMPELQSLHLEGLQTLYDRNNSSVLCKTLKRLCLSDTYFLRDDERLIWKPILVFLQRFTSLEEFKLIVDDAEAHILYLIMHA